MKQIKIEVPTGYEIDQENSNLAEGIVKFKEMSKENLLIQEFKKRYKGKGIKCLHSCKSVKSLDEIRHFDYNENGDCLRYHVKDGGVGCCYCRGKWAEAIETGRVPKSIDDVNGRDWYIDALGAIDFESQSPTPNHFSTAERAEAMLALGQLIEIHAAVKQDKDTECYFFSIESVDKNVVIDFWFETEELKEEFISLHKQLIETVKKGL